MLAAATRLARNVARSDTEAHHGHLALGDAAFYGLGVPLDRSQAARHYEAVQPSGRVAIFDAVARKQASFSLGFMHQHGLGVRQDFDAAQKCALLLLHEHILLSLTSLWRRVLHLAMCECTARFACLQLLSLKSAMS
jgi:TPR repeat protein